MNKIESVKFPDIDELFGLNDRFHIIAGPCSVESEEQMRIICENMSRHQLRLLRGGIVKPRTSPYAFQGLEEKGYEVIRKIKEQYNMIMISEVMDEESLKRSEGVVDVIQIGARNMMNYSLLKAVGKADRPVLLKRGPMATVEEFLMAAEYILLGGNEKLIMCERGIRTFETETRNTLDLSCVAILKNRYQVPVVVDISHSLGRKDIVIPIALACKAVGADGVMAEIHPDPPNALSDAAQQMNMEEFDKLVSALRGSGDTHIMER